ncbi:hypothetical protein D9757_006187 [Collybiopsis confluens]|uniref:Uncharacterized protein n=1 Tax=Collybiopsis confluens TaxID=2823264 RepID=A0A8H5M8I4_9AGAR|nr:hypothetical protein D9757_006187 [Collybiopsis confluens]
MGPAANAAGFARSRGCRTAPRPTNETLTTGKRKRSINWGGKRAGSGRKRKITVTRAVLSPPAPISAAVVTYSGSANMASGFFAPRMQTRVVGLDVLAGAPGTNPSTFLVENSASAQLTPSLPPASLSHLTAAEYTHLSSEINFIQNHDEHADIASGFQDTQEGLADETLESPDNFASAAQREAQSSEPIVNSALQQYLVATLERLGKQIKKHGQPDCYRRGDFIIRPKHAIFILHDAARTGLASDYLCHRDIFVWLPALLPGAPEAFKCTCGKRLSKNGYNDNPVARRVKSLPADYFLLTNRFLCDSARQTDTGCGTSWQGTDPHIIAQLPRWVSIAFPAYLSASGAIDKGIMSQMCKTFATRFGPSPFAEMMAELQRKHHSELELMYFDAARYQNLYGSQQIPPFSAFDDPLHYAGSPPSTHYLKALFVEWVTAHRPFIERAQACLPADIMKVDHTFHYLKYMGGLNGQRIHEASYTNVNQFEEIRSLALVPSKSLLYVAETLQGVVKGLQKNGHPPCSIVYTDSPQTEHQFHEKITPSLLKNVQHILPSQSSIPFKPSKDMKVFFVEDAAFMDQLCADILQQVDLSPSSHSSHLLVAFDVQVIPLASSVQAIQLCTPQINIVFKTSHIHSQKHFPAALRAILTSQSIIKLGCQVKQGLLEIAKCYNDNEIQVSLESNPAILEIGLHSKLKEQ